MSIIHWLLSLFSKKSAPVEEDFPECIDCGMSLAPWEHIQCDDCAHRDHPEFPHKHEFR